MTSMDGLNVPDSLTLSLPEGFNSSMSNVTASLAHTRVTYCSTGYYLILFSKIRKLTNS